MQNLFSSSFFSETVSPWLLTSGTQILLTLLIGYFTHKFSGIFIERTVRKIIRPDHFLTPEAEKKREDTLIRIISGTVGTLIIVVALMMMLEELGIAVGPIIAAAGVVGIAFGFGGQYLIRDVISGLFIIMENQYRVGDVVCFDGTCGLVEDISLRMTTLRDLDGTVHHVPHGEIKKVANMSKDYARVNLDIGVAYSSKLDHVIEVVNRVGHEIAEDEVWKSKIIKAPQFLRVNSFGDSAIIIKILGETQPIEQWAVAGELRKRLKLAFDAEGIEIPFPQRVIHQN